ncbi:MAG TPA: hypothetical protein VF743_05285, partial [Acidimicrobiales bacterium]
MAYETGPGDLSDTGDRSTAERPGSRQALRLALIGVLLLVAVAFVVQNSERVETTFLFFSVTTRLWVGILVALLLGAVLG